MRAQPLVSTCIFDRLPILLSVTRQFHRYIKPQHMVFFAVIKNTICCGIVQIVFWCSDTLSAETPTATEYEPQRSNVKNSVQIITIVAIELGKPGKPGTDGKPGKAGTNGKPGKASIRIPGKKFPWFFQRISDPAQGLRG